MTFIIFLLSYSLLLVLTGLFINGWYRITRHVIVIQPDNTETVEGLIFKWFSYWIEKVKGTKEIHYSGDALDEKYNELCRLLPKIGQQLFINEIGQFLVVIPGAEISTDEIDKIERVLKVKVEKTNMLLLLYLEEDIYWLPSWVRNPTSQCQICMASVYGSISYWAFVFLTDGAFDWTSHKKIAIFAIYCFFLVILSCVGYLFARKIN